MRPVLHGDISSAARALLAVPQTERARLCSLMIAEAELADAHVARTGRLHPIHGNGSLMATARNRGLADEPGFDDIDYCRCFELVLQQLIHNQASRSRNCVPRSA